MEATYRYVKKTNWEKYKHILKKELQSVRTNFTNLDLDEKAETLENIITNAYTISNKPKIHKPSTKPSWWNAKLNKLKRIIKSTLTGIGENQQRKIEKYGRKHREHIKESSGKPKEKGGKHSAVNYMT